MNRTSLLRKISTLGVTALAGIGAFAASAPAASAWTGQGAGSRGSISMPTVYVGDLLMPSGYRQFTLYGNTGPTANRIAGSTGAQIIKAKYYLQKWNGSAWTVITQSPQLSGQMTASQSSVRFTAPYLQPTVARGYFRVTWGFDWYTTTNVLLGSTFVSSNLTSDHVCVTPVRACQSAAGYVRTGLNLNQW